MKIDFDKNIEYYKSKQSTPCDCEVCQIYYKNIKSKYPEIVNYLESIKVDILRPFELIWLENEEKKQIEFYGCQYIVFGECEDDFKLQIGNITLEKTYIHPSTDNIKGKHFVLEFGTIILPDEK